MTARTRTILIALGTTLIACILLAGIIWCSYIPNPKTCQQLIIQISDKNQRNYISENDIQNYLLRNSLSIKNMALSEVPLQKIEEVLRCHPMIRTAECYTTYPNNVQIHLTQRVPMLRVVTPVESYIIDTDRKRMPIWPSVHTDVLVVSGHVGERMAKEELYDMVQWINKNHFWKKRITRIEVLEGKQIVLRQANNEPKILLGEMNDYTGKMRKLRMFIEKTTDEMEIPTYTTLDIRFKDQVVGIK